MHWRPWIAAGLSLVYPGLGHLYLRTWLRAVGWLAMALIAAGLVIPESVVRAYETGGFEAVLAATRTLPMEALVPLFVVRALVVADAFFVGRRQIQQRSRVAAGSAGTCPECGKELDEELAFCPWCTTRLDEVGGSQGEDGTDAGGLLAGRGNGP